MFFINNYKEVLNTSILTLYKACEIVRGDKIVFTVFGDREKEVITWCDVWFFIEKGGVSNENIINCVKEYKKAGILEDEIGFNTDTIKEIVFNKLNSEKVNISVKF